MGSLTTFFASTTLSRVYSNEEMYYDVNFIVTGVSKRDVAKKENVAVEMDVRDEVSGQATAKALAVA